MNEYRQLVDYFIERTNTRFDKIEKKIDLLLEFKWKVVGGTILASLFLTGVFQILLALLKDNFV